MCVNRFFEYCIGIVFTFGAFQGYAAEVATIEMQSAKNYGAIVTRTNVITMDEKRVRIDYLGVESKKSEVTP